jgi:DNA (cytosine-5)-methyltransferase 1
MRILDLFCGAGGAAMGLHRACPDAVIVGVDIAPQKHYPFMFVQGDAMATPLEGYDFIWASPPCQAHSALKHYGTNLGRAWPDYIPNLRLRLLVAGAPYVIENVLRAPLLRPALLCGQMFGLPLMRHRLFETNWPLLVPPHVVPCLRRHNGKVVTVAGHGGGRSRSNRRMNWIKQEGQAAMGIDWMTRRELTQSVPPAYSEFILRQFVSLGG